MIGGKTPGGKKRKKLQEKEQRRDHGKDDNRGERTEGRGQAIDLVI